MVTLGIGCIHHSVVSQYQYACVLEIHSLLQISKPVEIFDPAMDYVLHNDYGYDVDGCKDSESFWKYYSHC